MHRFFKGTETDFELMDCISQRSSFGEKADEAWRIFHDRYHKLLYAQAFKICRHSEEASDLVHDTLLRVIEKAKTFRNKEPLKEKKYSPQTLGWMIKIMKNIYFDGLEIPDESEHKGSDLIIFQFKLIPDSDDDEDERGESELGGDEPIDVSDSLGTSSNMLMLDKHLSTLSDRDQDIIRGYARYYEPGGRTPTHIVKELAMENGTTPSNVKKIWQRAKAKIAVKTTAHIKLRN